MSDRSFTSQSPMVNVMAAAALKASKGLLRDFREVESLQVSKKGPKDFVSNADKRSEKIIYETLRSFYPGYNFLMEESGRICECSDNDSPEWVVDPLDGTNNFLHGVPYFAVSIALKVKGAVTAGIVYDPIRDEMFWAHKGMGAFVNDKRIRVSARANPEDFMVSVGFGQGICMENKVEFSESARVIASKVCSVRSIGAAALNLAYVASGRFDGFYEHKAIEWDIAAGSLLISEAGGFVSDMSGGRDMLKKSEIIAGNQYVHKFLRKEIMQFAS
ncbi:inositol monophosphatase family protein [Candidatus Hydrogenosomobacter endosymbioticus]|uniref:Inositol-1-monophosphatase n=1 Tax=Candidatus Hydrogenosomobacter endosymbioticus TaxID=2558174 RepID=A0ABM7V9F2_9PROT|nr:inositol monophosphatase family protein [Candidatus Hydrogenosomobacter endosymbioticus]BDB96426.1 inositol monophosphatase [Candidatus Hydrogenosomobacter endosymbioticus]